MILSTTRHTCWVVAVCFAVAIAAACNGGGPTAPSSVAPTTTVAPVNPTPGGSGILEITITPSPVPWSSEPIEGCSLPHTWRYDQLLKNMGETQITISDRTDSFDGVQVSARSGLGIVLPPGADTSIRTRWCSAYSTEHRTQTTFSGSDAAGNRINVAGPVVRLMAR